MDLKSLALLDKTTKRELICAFILIIVIGILFVYEYQRQTLASYSPEIINMAGKQRMLSQRISYLQHLVVTDSDNQLRTTWQAEMRLLLDEFEGAHKVLSGQVPLVDGYTISLSDVLREHYFEGKNALNNQMATFISVNTEVSKVSGNNYLNYYTPEQSATILKSLDTAVSMHERQSQVFNQDASLGLSLLWLFSILLLPLAYRILKRPLLQTIENQRQTHLETTEELAFTREELEHQIEQRSVYINKITHDLRSPVSAIMSVIDLLPNSRGESKSLLRQAEIACQRLLKYTDDLSDIIKPKADKGARRPFNLISLLDDSLAKTANACELKGISFDVNSQNSLPEMVISYPRVIRKCIENVLENAVLYTREGSISVNFKIVEHHSDMVMTVAVSDTGIGIPAHHLEHIFERFKRLPSNQVEKERLTGVGLAITRECLDEIGGDISVLSHYGHGSTFTMQFPLTKVSAEDVAAFTPPIRHTDIKFAIIDDFEISRMHLKQLVNKAGYICDVYTSSTNFFEYKHKIGEYAALIIDYYMPGLNGEELVLTLNAMLGEKMPAVMMVSSSPDIANIVANSRIKAWQVFTKPLMENRFVDAIEQIVADSGEIIPERTGNILLVEDEKINAEMMHHMLTNMGYITKVANDGESAMALVESYKFDCILLDIHLPDTDGFTLIEKLKHRGINAPIIIISGDTADETEVRALEAGVRYCLFKPVPFQELKNTLRLTLSRSKNKLAS